MTLRKERPDAHEPPAAWGSPLSRLIVHLDALAQNYLSLKKKLGPGADLAAVVKADAYGLGAAPVAQALYAQGCREFFTASIDEALSLQAALRPLAAGKGQSPVFYILNGIHGADPDIFAAEGLVPVLNSLPEIRAWAEHAGRISRKLPAVIHIDTGMNRLGLNVTEALFLAEDRAMLKALDVRCVMSHLACSDMPDHPKNREQLDLFRKAADALNLPARRSLANSGGIFLGPEYHFDIVRPGAALYGINFAGANPMRRTVTLEGQILQVRTTDRAGSVGYGARHDVAAGVRCATVSAGYADGYLCSLAGRGAVFIGGQRCPVLGRVSMDSIVADVSALKALPVPGDWAEIIGEHQSVDDVAAQAGTIGYEILTSLGARLKRHYEGA